MRLLFLASGGGGDYLALQKAREHGRLDFETAHLVCTAPDTPCVEHARRSGLPVTVLDPAALGRAGLDRAVEGLLEAASFDLCFLAGYRYILPEGVTARHEKRIMNSHHSILPAYPGLYKKEALVGSDAKLLGATVHYVDSGVDTGQIICQAAFPNYGADAFDRILGLFRAVQDVLAVTALRIASGTSFGPRAATRGEVLFWPAPDQGDMDLFFSHRENAL